MASAAAVKQKLQLLLPSLDLDTVTERSIRERLTTDLGTVTKHHALIKAEIEKYLSAVADDGGDDGGAYRPGQASSGSDDDEESDGNSEDGSDDDEDGSSGGGKSKAAAGAKRARPAAKAGKAAAASPAAAGSSKKAKGSSEASGSGGLIVLGGMKRASVSHYKQNINVDLREYYMDKKSNEEKPSPKGISLPPDQWARLCAGLPKLVAALAEGSEDCEVPLGSLRKAYVSKYKNTLLMHVREMYEKHDGEQLPGKKGIALDASSVKILQRHAAALTAQLGDQAVEATEVAVPVTKQQQQSQQQLLRAAATATPAARVSQDGPAGASGSGTSPGSQEGVKAETGGVGGGGAEAGVSGGGISGEPFRADIGPMKRVSVSMYKGNVNVDMREFYTDKVTGEEKPGFKGIALKPDQWAVLSTGLPQLAVALSNGDDKFSIQLGNLRKAYISKYKGACLLHIREMYEKDGGELPGKKGLTLDSASLKLLQQHAAAVTAQLESM